MDFKKWTLRLTALLLAALVILGSVTVVIDPFFHYHAPLVGLQYELFQQRYQNDGIVKHFDYNALITGNSMCENFKSSEFDALFSVSSVKVPFSGASAKELDENNRAAIKANKSIKLILMGIDYDNLVADKDMMSYDEDEYPRYLYDSNPFNDVKYLFNKSIFKTSLDTISYTLAGNKTTSFDDYSFWDTDGQPYGRDIILMTYSRPDKADTELALDEATRETVRANVTQNILETARANPDIEFYLFFPPYSIFYWDEQQRLGALSLRFEAEREAIELMLDCGNIRLFSFLDEFELVCDLSRYKDYIHYDSGVNSWMLECMAEGGHQLTKANYLDYLARTEEFYTGYDYDKLFE